MNLLIKKAIADKIAEDAWSDYQEMVAAGEIEETTDPKTIFKRGVYHAVAGVMAAMELNIIEQAQKN